MRLRFYNPNDLHAVNKIANNALGEGYFSFEMPHENNAQNIFLLVAESDENQVVGFCYFLISNLNFEEERLKFAINEIKSENNRVGVLKTIVVRPSFKRKGIGSSLVQKMLDTLKAVDIEKVYAIAWNQNGNINLGGILNKFNFIPLAEIEKYWHDDSIEKQYQCSECGSPPCNCSAIIFSKNI